MDLDRFISGLEARLGRQDKSTDTGSTEAIDAMASFWCHRCPHGATRDPSVWFTVVFLTPTFRPAAVIPCLWFPKSGDAGTDGQG